MWKKRGLIFNSKDTSPFAVTGAMIPTPVQLNETELRVYLTFLDSAGIGRPGYVDLDAKNLHKVVRISTEPIFDIGIPGSFDDNGALLCSVVQLKDGRKYFYYAGFELSTKIRYRLLSGLVVTDHDHKILKKYNTPVLERSEKEQLFRGGPFCIEDNGLFKMWYVAGSDWTKIDGQLKPVYEIKYLESHDGVKWGSEGKTCIKIENPNEHGFGRPWVVYENGMYKMHYSIRVKHLGYRLGYAESVDGVSWNRLDHKMNLDVSKEGFDDKMICYSAVTQVQGKPILFYNGNEFGKTGFGYAELSDGD
jgi:hypothetical protein